MNIKAMKSKFWNIHTAWILVIQLVYSACTVPDQLMGSYEVDEAYWQPGEAFGKPEVLSAGQLNSDADSAPQGQNEEDFYDPSVLNQDNELNDLGNGGMTPMWDPIMGWRMSYPWGNGIGLNNSLALGYSLSPWGSYPYYGYSPYATGYNMMWGNPMYTAPYYGNYYGANPYWNGGFGNNFWGQNNFNNNNDPVNTTQVPRTNGSGASGNSGGAPVLNHRPKMNATIYAGERKNVVIQDNARQENKAQGSGKVWRDIGRVLEAAAKATDGGGSDQLTSPSRGNSGGKGFESPASSPSRGSGISVGGARPSASPSRSTGGKRP
jgi:hypothetical protein